MTRIETILLATDASPASGAAAEQAIDLAARLGARLLVLSVLGTGRSAARPDPPARRWRASSQRARAAGAEAAGHDSGRATPGETIVEAAAAEGADLIVVGTHGRGPVGRLFLGSVSDYVVRHARCPVLVVRPSSTTAADRAGGRSAPARDAGHGPTRPGDAGPAAAIARSPTSCTCPPGRAPRG